MTCTSWPERLHLSTKVKLHNSTVGATPTVVDPEPDNPSTAFSRQSFDDSIFLAWFRAYDTHLVVPESTDRKSGLTGRNVHDDG